MIIKRDCSSSMVDQYQIIVNNRCVTIERTLFSVAAGAFCISDQRTIGRRKRNQ